MASQVASSPTGIGARCNTGTAYEIAPGDGLNYGLNADFPNHRSLSGPGFFLAYSLHRDMVGGETWGAGADQISGVGNGGVVRSLKARRGNDRGFGVCSRTRHLPEAAAGVFFGVRRYK